MHRLRLRKPSPALAVAIVALFVAVGGTSYAAFSLPKNSVGSKQLKKNAVTSGKIKDGAVTSSKLDTSGLTVPNAANATHATNADTATVGGPVAFATVFPNGSVFPEHSRGIDSSNITHAGISSYCFRNLPPFKFALSSVAYGDNLAPFNGPISADISYADGPENGTLFNSDCPGAELEVTVATSSGFQPETFMIALYN
jgi:hypothetical protein